MHDNPLTLAEQFNEFFVRKIDSIQVSIDELCQQENLRPFTTVRNQTADTTTFSEFKYLSEEEVKSIINSSSSKSCSLDPIPTWLVKQCIDQLLPVITSLINLSLQSGYFPDDWKCAIITPILKKLGLDAIFKNYRPISNLPYISKLTETAVANQLNNHNETNSLLPPCTSAYRKFHSTETALLKVQSDIFSNMDKQKVTMLVMLDLSAAFDTVSHEILLSTLHSQYGLDGKVLGWFESYLFKRQQKINVNKMQSNQKELRCGVPQGSCLGPLLFNMYISSLYQVVEKHLPSVHGFADDHQLYLSFKPDSESTSASVKAMEVCVNDVRQWMLTNRLLINDSKTEILLLGTKQQLSKLDISGLAIGEKTIYPAKYVKNLGIIQDEHLKLDKHVSSLSSKSFYQLYKIRKLRKYLTTDATKILLHAFITSNLDYCNSLFYGMPKFLIKKLQRIQNASARVLLKVPKHNHITQILCDLHWLPLQYRIMFKIVLLTFKCLIGKAPDYLRSFIKVYTPGRCLRSNTGVLLDIPRLQTKTLGCRSFEYSAPFLWNNLPLSLRSIKLLDHFKQELKTYYFRLAYNL